MVSNCTGLSQSSAEWRTAVKTRYATLGAVNFVDALEADVLWGWPVDVLDQLAELRTLAWRGEISLGQWRERDTAGRQGMPEVDTDEVRRFQRDWIEHWVLDVSGAVPEEAGDRLRRRLAALLDPAPSDEELWDELVSISDALSQLKRERRLEEVYRRKRDRIAAWLTRGGSGVDPVTGLPWSHIARYRILDDPDLGPVPQYVNSARQLAERSASAEERRRAALVREPGDWQRLAVPMADLSKEKLTWLPRLLLQAAENDDRVRPLQADLTRIWCDPRVQQLLFQETSPGWPADVDRKAGHREPAAG